MPTRDILLALLAGTCLAATSAGVAAQEAKKPFQVGRGPASAALPEFARQAGTTVLANGDDLANRTTAELRGTYTLRQAVDLLLAGSGLVARFNGGTVLVEAAPAPAAPAAAAPRPAPRAPAHADAMPQVLIAGPRAAQQGSIEQKRNADTARDTILADDVGAFPDRNVAEAISRLAGVTLERGEYGEGTTINVRGNPANQTRVEIDGLGVQAGGGTDLNNGGSGRGVELRELSADLIKSIDVVKGATADMTEGSIGGSVIIRTRTGLDFRQRYVALRVAGQQNSINERWTPNLNFVFADQFLDKRLGVVLNVGRSAAHNENHTINVSQLANGMERLVDFDNSPEKTFAYNPSTVSTTDPAATAPLARWSTTGGGTFNALSPLEIVTRSAAAATKADCYAAFPLYSSADVAAIASAVNRAAARNQRANELRSCLNQWSDYTPQNLRYQMRRQYDRRLNGDLRVDFKVSDRLSLYAKYDANRRRITDDQLFLSLGNILVNREGTYTDAGTAPNIVRTPLAGYFLYPTPSNLGTSGSTWRGLTDGSAVNVVPSSVVVDANHHVTQYTLANAILNNDQIYDRIATSATYAQAGGTWRAGNFKADFLVGRAGAEATRMQWRTSFSFPYGPATVSVSPDGIWTYSSADAGYDQRDMANYGILTQAGATQPLVSGATSLTLANPRLMQRQEDTARLDMSWAPAGMPFLDRLKFGLSRRAYRVDSWTGSGYTVSSASNGSPAVVVPRVAGTSTFQACENTVGSLAAGGTPCNYGATSSANPATAFVSNIVLPQADYRAIVAQSLAHDTIAYFNSLPGRPAGLPSGWTEIDVPKVIALTGVQHFDLACVRWCTASDGKVYEQPRAGVKERTWAGYFSADFSAQRWPFTQRALPFGSELEGNFGWRVVRTDVAATGLMTFESIRRTAAYDPLNPDAAAGIVKSTLSRNLATVGASTDVMPILNLAWWPLRNRAVLRYSRAKAIARPPVDYLYSQGVTCTYDERRLAGAATADMTCDDTLGNPSLRPAVNRNHNLSLEWYPDRDTMLSVAAFRQRGVVGAPIRVGVTGAQPFAGSGAADPATGADLSGVRYAYATYVNGPASERNGVEVSAKLAFAFLPAALRNTGMDMNYTHARSRNLEDAVRDLVTGDVLAPANELKYTWNASLWYDDGRLQARVALQSAAAFFRGLTTQQNNYPANGVTGSPAVPFNPATPTFRDARRFVDAKVAWRFGNGLEAFVEGRNLGRVAVTNSQGAYAPFANGTPNLLDYAYSGAQYMVGITLRH